MYNPYFCVILIFCLSVMEGIKNYTGLCIHFSNFEFCDFSTFDFLIFKVYLIPISPRILQPESWFWSHCQKLYVEYRSGYNSISTTTTLPVYKIRQCSLFSFYFYYMFTDKSTSRCTCRCIITMGSRSLIQDVPMELSTSCYHVH